MMIPERNNDVYNHPQSEKEITQDGDVEIVASGDKESLKKFVEWCHKGSSRALVTRVTITPIDAGNFSEFRILK